VGETTHHVTSGAIACEHAGEQLLRGKAAPVPAWRAVRVVAERRGRGRDDRLEAPFVGREAELRLLKDLFHATSRERRVRLVSITGQAGIGKSRLAWEFLKYVDGVVERVRWHEGRSPAYGEGITFWALGEMIRSRAGLLESDDAQTTRERIAAMLAENVPDDAERRRLEPALLGLLGVAEGALASGEELFGAWRTFFERLASDAVVALVFEDLHWADPGTLDFIEHMLEWSRGVPIMIITLARPELLEKRPDWGAGRRAFLALDLQPLDDASMEQLLHGLAPGLPDAAVRSIVTRAEGIPLYGVETIRMLVADGRLVPREGGGFDPAGELGELAVPESLHALIAARLDALEPADRSLIQDAAVLGQSFSVAGAAAVSGLDEAEAAQRLDQLVRADLLRHEVDPRSPERGQYAFVQALIREVAYATLSLRDRRTRHLAAARLFESLGDEELAGALAAHYLAAFRASTEGPEAEALAGQARIALKAAAERAAGLGSPGQAVTFLEQAIEVTTDPRERADLEERAGAAAANAARSDAALGHFEAATALLDGLDDRSGQARLVALEGLALSRLRRREEAGTRLEAALKRFEELGDDDPNLVRLIRVAASNRESLGDYDGATALADRALGSAERLGLAEDAAACLSMLGLAAFNRGRLWTARSLITGARQVAEEAGLADVALRTMVLLPSILALDDPRASVALARESIDAARRLGRRNEELGILHNAVEDARRPGDWDWAVAELDAVDQLEVDETTRLANRTQQTFYGIYRGTYDAAAVPDLVRDIQAMQDRDMQSGVLDLEGCIAHASGRWGEAAEAWLQVADVSDLNAPYSLPKAGRVAIQAGDGATARRALERLSALGTRGRVTDADRAVVRAGLAAIAGDQGSALSGYRAAMTQFRDLGLAWDEALLGLEAATTLGASNPEVGVWIKSSREIFTRLGAAPMLDRLEEAVERDETASAAGSRAAPDEDAVRAQER
jgi:tetratricopeptide (TPR) repeat protein